MSDMTDFADKALWAVASGTVGAQIMLWREHYAFRLEVAKKYAGQKDAEAKIATTIVKGTPTPAGLGWQKAGSATLPFMPPNAAVKPDEAAKLAKWILSQK